ncbi:MAG: translation initiation factor eIF-2B subunit [archaeon]
MKFQNAKKRFEKICKDIKALKIQGAENVAIAGIKAYSIIPTEQSIKRLLSLRATEPALKRSLMHAKKFGTAAALNHFKASQDKINQNVLKIIKNNFVIFTHCHSNTAIRALIYAKKKGKKFSVVNTETRPLFQGRKTAIDLSKAGIKVTTMVDSGARIELQKADCMIIGCDAILRNGDAINKIGSGMFAQIASEMKKPVYIVTDSWKFSKEKVSIEERNFEEIWKIMKKNIRIENPAFEKVEHKYITAIISEMGILKPKEFAKKLK